VTLLAEVLGVLFGGAAIASLPQFAGSPEFGRMAGVAFVVVAVSSLLFFQTVWAQSRAFPPATRANAAISKPAAELAGAVGTDTAFLAWARTKILSGHGAPTFWLLPAAADTLIYQWSTYQLLPARQTDLPRDANWIVFYRVAPASVAYDRTAFSRLFIYAPGFAVALRTNAG
jgi:hypothetical protein